MSLNPKILFFILQTTAANTRWKNCRPTRVSVTEVAYLLKMANATRHAYKKTLRHHSELITLQDKHTTIWGVGGGGLLNDDIKVLFLKISSTGTFPQVAC